MNCHKLTGLIAGLLALSACGGGGDSSSGGGDPIGGGGGTPTPSPTATPTPGPSYSTYSALSGDREFALACQGVIQTPGQAFPIQAVPFGSDVQTLSYDTSEQSWLIKGLGIEQLFTPEDIFTPETPFPTVEEQYLVMVNNQPVASMNILAPEPGGMALEYARNLTYAIRNEFQGNNFENGNCVFGVPTLPDDQPNATSVTYADYATIGSIIYVYDDGTFAAYRISGSEEAISVNLNTFAVDISMHLIGTLDDNSTSGAGSAAEATLDLGTFTANGIQIDDEPYGIGGYFDAPNPSAEMPFQGWFFGPQGKEIAFSYSKQMADGYRSFGAVNLVARR